MYSFNNKNLNNYKIKIKNILYYYLKKKIYLNVK